MSQSGAGSGPARPRQVTVAGVLATVSCVLLVAGLFDAMVEVRSTDTQKSIRDFLSSAPGDRLGVDVDGVVDLLRGVVLLSGALAAAGAILGVYCLRRHRGARVGLSAVAVAMLFTTTFVAGLLPFVVALAASMLWRREARDWFDGRPPRPASPAARPSTSPPISPPISPPAGPPAGGSTAWSPPTGAASWPPPSPQPFGWPPPPHAGPAPAASRRPVAVTVAVSLTWASCAVALLLLGLLVLLLLVDRSALVSELQKDRRVASLGYTADQLTGGLWVLAAVAIVWTLAAAAFAALAFRRVRAGQVGLVLCAVLSAVFGIGTVVVPVVALVTVVLLLRPGSNAWFAGARDHDGPPSGPARPAGPAAPSPPPGEPPPGKPPVW